MTNCKKSVFVACTIFLFFFLLSPFEGVKGNLSFNQGKKEKLSKGKEESDSRDDKVHHKRPTKGSKGHYRGEKIFLSKVDSVNGISEEKLDQEKEGKILQMNPLPFKIFDEKNFRILYHKAIRNYQEKKFHQADQIFSEILEYKDLEKNINPSSLFYNIGLNEYQLKNYAKAMAWLQRAILFSPLLFQAREVIRQSKSRLEIEESENSLWHFFKDRVFSYFSLNFILLSTFLLLIFFLSFTFRFFRRSLGFTKGTKKASIFLTLRLISMILFFISLTLSGFKIYDFLNPRAVVILPEAKLRIAPDAESNILLDLNSGVEVILKERQGNWFRVLSSKGTMGWIQENFLFQTTGRKFSL